MNGAPFVEMPDPFRQLQGLMLRKPGGDRDPLGTLLRNTLPGDGWLIFYPWFYSMTNRLCSAP
jgi:hypothetical protein